jgi:DNA-binding MarR family transcriptional regulator
LYGRKASRLPITRKTVKGIKYLYFAYYDPSTKRKKEIYCGAENNPAAQAKARELEHSHLEKRLASIGNRLINVDGEAEITEYLSRKGDRPDNIAQVLGLKSRSMSEALQRLISKGIVKKEESGVYSLTEQGKQEQDRREPRAKYLADTIARHADKLPQEKVELLKELYDSILQNLEQPREPPARRRMGGRSKDDRS